jgi:hypothetical protein
MSGPRLFRLKQIDVPWGDYGGVAQTPVSASGSTRGCQGRGQSTSSTS